MKLNKKTQIILIIDVILAFLALYNSYLISLKPIIPDFKNLEDLKFESNSEFFNAGDSLTKIDNFRVQNSEEVQFICDRYDVGDNVLVDVVSNGQTYQRNIKLTNYYPAFYIFVMIMVGFTFYFTGIFVLIRNQYLKFSYIFHWFAIAAAGMILLDWGKIQMNFIWPSILIRSLYDAALIFTPLLFVHFSLLFPISKFPKFSKFYKYIYLIGSIFWIVIGIYQLQLFQAFSSEVFSHYIFLNVYHSKFLMLPAFIFILINYIHSYTIAREEEDKRKLKWIFIGLLSGPAFYTLFYELLKLIIKRQVVDETLMLALLIISPITFFIAIYHYRIIDINLLVSRGLIYSVFLFIFAAIFASLAAIFGHLIDELSSGNITLNLYSGNYIDFNLTYFLISIIAILIFQPLRSKVKDYINKKLFRTRYNYKVVLQNFLSKVNDFTVESEIVDFFIHSFQKAIPVRSYSLIWSNTEFKMLKQQGFSSEHLFFDKIYEFLNSTNWHIVYAQNEVTEEEIDTPKLTSEFNDFGIKVICNSFISTEQPILTLLLGEKKSSTKFSVEDIELLITLLDTTNSVLQKLKLKSELILKQNEAEKLREISEMKSFFVSSVSHELKTPLTAIKLYAEFLIQILTYLRKKRKIT